MLRFSLSLSSQGRGISSQNLRQGSKEQYTTDGLAGYTLTLRTDMHLDLCHHRGKKATEPASSSCFPGATYGVHQATRADHQCAGADAGQPQCGASYGSG